MSKISRQPSGGLSKNRNDARLIVPLEEREEFMANTIAKECSVTVTLISSIGKTTHIEVMKDILTTLLKEGAYYHSMFGSHSREAEATRTTEEPKEQGFSLIILMVGHGDEGSLFGQAYFFKKPIADIAEPLFEVGRMSDSWMKDREGEAVESGSLPDKGLIEV
jgi:hypothetical protein